MKPTSRPFAVIATALLLAACNEAGGEAAAADAAPAGTDAADASPVAASDEAAAANPLAPGWLVLQGKAGPEKGRYACQDWAGYTAAKVQADALYGGSVRQSSHFTTQFSITGKKSYVYHGSRGIDGAYDYNAQTGAISWKTGPYSSDPGEESWIEGIYGVRQSDGKPTVVQIFHDPAYGEAAELCFKYEE